MANLSYKIKILVCINLLFSIVFFGLAVLNPFIKLPKNLEGKWKFAMALHIIISLLHLIFSCPIMCSSTSLGDPMSDDERACVYYFFNLCFRCKEMARIARLANGKFSYIITIIVFDIIGLILYIIFFSKDKLFKHTIVIYGLSILIKILFCIFRKRMSLFQDYDEVQETVKDFEKSKDCIEMGEGNFQKAQISG